MRRSGAALLLVALAGAAAGRAEPGVAPPAPPALRPPEVRQDAITLADAIRLTVDYSPDVLLARQSAEIGRGTLQQMTGQFDSLAEIQPSYSRVHTVLTPSELLPQISQRQFLSQASNNLTLVANDISRGLVQGQVTLPDCQGQQYFINGTPLCLGSGGPTNVQQSLFLLGAQAPAANLPQGSATDKLSSALEAAGQQKLQSVLFLTRQIFIPALDKQLLALGGLPSLSNEDTLDLTLTYTLQTRLGLSYGPIVFFEGIRDNFAGKSDNPALGGLGSPTLYRSAVGLSINTPLLKGFGRDSVTAAESAARENYRAALEVLAHTGAQAALRTTLSYWNLAAAQDQLTLLQRSAEAQKRIVEVTSALVQADELPRIELDRAAARTADLEGAIAAARRNIASSRVALAVAMGVAVPDEAHAPLAADPLPAGTEPGVAAGTSLTGLLDAAVSRRADVKAERLQESGAEFLLKGTQADLKPQVNLSLQAGYTGIYQDPRYNVLNVYDVTGYWRTFKGLYVGPSVQLTLTFDIPFKNNAAKGQYVQADALVGSAFITRKDLERTVRANIVDLEAALRSASAEVRSREAAARAGRELLSSGREQFRGGELSLLDTLVTEQTQTQAEADLVAARLMYASREARLRFETGTLLPYTILDGGVSFGPATPTGPLAGPKP